MILPCFLISNLDPSLPSSSSSSSLLPVPATTPIAATHVVGLAPLVPTPVIPHRASHSTAAAASSATVTASKAGLAAGATPCTAAGAGSAASPTAATLIFP